MEARPNGKEIKVKDMPSWVKICIWVVKSECKASKLVGISLWILLFYQASQREGEQSCQCT